MLVLLVRLLVTLIAAIAMGAPVYEALVSPPRLSQPPPLFNVSSAHLDATGHHRVVGFGGC